MPTSLFDNAIGKQEVAIDCPQCKKEFNIKINQAGTSVNCPYCSCKINLKETGDGFSNAKKAMDDLEKTLNNF